MARGCHILIDKDPYAESSTLGDLTEEELVAKANEEINQMDEAAHKNDNAIRFIGAKKLSCRGIVLDLITREAAKWIQDHRETNSAPPQ
jgi:hypothetical protein